MSEGGAARTPDPPSLNPANWDVEDTLWIVYYATDSNPTATAYPINYNSNQYTGEAPGTAMGIAMRAPAVASEESRRIYSLSG